MVTVPKDEFPVHRTKTMETILSLLESNGPMRIIEMQNKSGMNLRTMRDAIERLVRLGEIDKKPTFRDMRGRVYFLKNKAGEEPNEQAIEELPAL